MTPQQFKQIRLDLGLSRSELGRIMGMSWEAIERIESRREPTKIQAAFIEYIKNTKGDELWKILANIS